VPESPSNFLTALLITDETYNTKDLNEYLKERGIFVCPTTNVSKYLENSSQTYFRVAHIGCDISEHKKLIAEMRKFFG
jgi:hypothetical protein